MASQGAAAIEAPSRAVGLLDEARTLRSREPEVFDILGLNEDDLAGTTQLLAGILAAAAGEARGAGSVRATASRVLVAQPGTVAAVLADVAVTAARNFEPGGEIATLLSARGVQALLGHRVAHALWVDGRRDLALALKTVFSRAFCTDIHPAARFGPGVWLDHGLGFVVGETALVEEGASIWHGVTLGSTLKSSGAARHPRLRRGCTVGADAVLLGGIEIGAGSVVAAGSVVLGDVPPGTTVAGVPAVPRSRGTDSFAGFDRRAS